MSKTDKPVVWLHGQVKTPPFSAAARVEAGVLLRRLQAGEQLALPHSRPMPTIGAGCHELRIVDREVTWRIVYCLDRQAIVILDVFAKKTGATPTSVITNCQQRLAAYRRVVDGRAQ
jgi:phage-related protein